MVYWKHGGLKDGSSATDGLSKMAQDVLSSFLFWYGQRDVELIKILQ